MSNVRHFEVAEDDDGQRLDRWIKKHVPEIPYTLAQKLMRQGQIRVDSKRAKPETRLSQGQKVRIPPVEARAQTVKPKIRPQDIEFIKSVVIFDDGDVAAINKPYDLPTQGGTKIRRHVDGMLDGLTNKKGVRPRLVHRLDRETSGVLLLARSAQSARALGEIFKGRHIKKIYYALVSPVPEMLQGTINAPIGKAPQKDKMMIDGADSKKARTEYVVIDKVTDQVALVAFWPRSGRTHQIRVHAAQVLNCPIIGDGRYGSRETELEGMHFLRRLHLHAARIICDHPGDKAKLDIRAPLPADLAKNWKTLGFNISLKEDPFEAITP